jgi:ACS family D-galactonate transporter-like MFS transporter
MLSASDARADASGRRWIIAALLGIGVLVNYFDRVNLSVSHQALLRNFGISDVLFGYLSAAYSWTYAICQFPSGVLLDRFGVRRVGRVSTFVWSVASFAAAITPNLGGFFAARLLLGVGEAPTFPANAKAVGLWFPPEDRSLPTSIFDSAAKLAPAIGVPLIGLLLLHIGWRLSFAFTGLISLAYFLLFWVVYRDPGRLGPSGQARAAHSPAPLLYLMRQRKIVGFALGFGAYNYVFYLLLTWLPSYLFTALHLDQLHSFLYTAFPWVFATLTDLLLGGWLVDALIHRGRDAYRVRRGVLLAGTACGLGIFGAAYAHSPAQSLFWISLSIGGLSAAAPVLWTLPSLIAPEGSVGEVGGIVNFSGQISAICAPIITGYFVEYRHSFFWAFAVAAAYLIAGIAGYLLLLGRFDPIPLFGSTPGKAAVDGADERPRKA